MKYSEKQVLFSPRRSSTANPRLRSVRAKKDEVLKLEVFRVGNENFKVYVVRKVWYQLKREGFTIARCTVSRLMKSDNIEGVRRGKSYKTTISDDLVHQPEDLTNFGSQISPMLGLNLVLYSQSL